MVEIYNDRKNRIFLDFDSVPAVFTLNSDGHNYKVTFGELKQVGNGDKYLNDLRNWIKANKSYIDSIVWNYNINAPILPKNSGLKLKH